MDAEESLQNNFFFTEVLDEQLTYIKRWARWTRDLLISLIFSKETPCRPLGYCVKDYFCIFQKNCIPFWLLTRLFLLDIFCFGQKFWAFLKSRPICFLWNVCYCRFCCCICWCCIKRSHKNCSLLIYLVQTCRQYYFADMSKESNKEKPYD